ncbi:uncharacterized protein LOC129316574 [Prosopis cineraria]|uniref:uncharacterized protein LOC129316574 n=1 Tax=Prosopis cineraria TaxID=364024 RepID=UPI00240F191F|nr:uncharacterized protein LOC129316574 [Prosopis cineraria]
MDSKQAGALRILQLNELEEFRYHAFESAKLYKERTKQWHDQHILHRTFEPGQLVLLFNSRLRLFPEKLKSQWSGPFKVLSVAPHGTIEVLDERTGKSFKVNGQLKHYWGGDIERLKSVVHLVDPP